MRTPCRTLIAACIAAAFVPVAHAEKFYGDSSISGLYSDDYEGFGGKESATVLTFENATGHNWGDTFFFIDRYEGQGRIDGSSDNTYGEFAPRLSLGWLTGKDLSFGPVKDVFVAGTYEFGGGTELNNYLAGLGLSWNIPGLQYFNTNLYYVDNNSDDVELENDVQLTVTWGAPFEIARARFLFDGFMDYSSGVSSDQKAEMHINPQLKLDLGHFSGNPGVLYAGFEYSYWRNKYGLSVLDTENAVSALVKFHF